MTARGRVGRIGAALLACIVLSGCVGLATNREVRPGLAIDGSDEKPLRVSFPGPVAGASQEQILRGFLRAGTASEGNYDNARLFLTPETAKGWNPDENIVITGGDATLTVSAGEGTTASVSAGVVATVDSEGRYAASAPDARTTLTVSFARIDGQWRISSLPQHFGRWIPTEETRRLLQPYAVNYVAADSRSLIRVLRWFPLDHLPSRLARAQLRSVPEELRGVASTSVPSGTRLTADSVSVVDGVATVDLTSRIPADHTQRQNVWAQFLSTLTQDPTVVAVTLKVEGAVVEVPGVSPPISTISQVGFLSPSFSPVSPPVVRRGTTLSLFDAAAAVSGNDPKLTPGEAFPDYPPIPADRIDLALAADASELADVSKDRNVLTRWRGDRAEEAPFFATELGHPAYDRRGNLWIGGVAAPGAPDLGVRLWVASLTVSAGSPMKPVAAGWLKGRRVLESRVSPDASRVAIVSVDSSGGGPRLQVAGIVRDQDGLPLSLAAPQTLGAGLSAITGLSWLDLDTLATLGRMSSKEARRPYLLGLGGDRTALPEAAGAIEITTTNGQRGIEVVTSTGQILSRVGQQWVPSGPGIDLIVPAG